MFLDAGYGPQIFWDLSIAEIGDILEAYARREQRRQQERKANMKDEIMLLFNQAIQIGNVIGKLVDKKTEVRLPAEYYPYIFKEEQEEQEETEETDFTEQDKEGDGRKLSPEMELHKARMDDFIFRHNRAMRMAQERGESGGRNDAGKASGDH